MKPKLNRKEWIRLSLPVALGIACLVVAGCGREEFEGEDAQLKFLLDTKVDNYERPPVGNQNIPVIFFERKRSGRDFVYRVQDQEYGEADIWAYVRKLLVVTPDLEFYLTPGAFVTADELALVEAKMRDAGAAKFRVKRQSERERDLYERY